MEIQTVKESEGGYIINGTISVPNASGNRHYKAVQEWIAEGNTPEPYQTDKERLDEKKDKKLKEFSDSVLEDIKTINPSITNPALLEMLVLLWPLLDTSNADPSLVTIKDKMVDFKSTKEIIKNADEATIDSMKPVKVK